MEYEGESKHRGQETDDQKGEGVSGCEKIPTPNPTHREIKHKFSDFKTR